MSNRRAFRPGPGEALETRRVLSLGATPVAVLHPDSGTMGMIATEIDHAFKSFSDDFQSAVGTLRVGQPVFGPLPNGVPSTSPSSPQSLDALRTATLQRVEFLSQEIEGLIAPLAGASTNLVPIIHREIVGPDEGSLARTLTTALDGMAASNTPNPGGFPIFQTNPGRAGDAIAGTRLATLDSVGLFLKTTQTQSQEPLAVHARGRRVTTQAQPAQALDTATTTNQVDQAYATFSTSLRKAVEALGRNPTPTDIENFRSSTVTLLDQLATQTNAALAPALGSSSLALSTVQGQILGLDPGSLLLTLNSSINAIPAYYPPPTVLNFAGPVAASPIAIDSSNVPALPGATATDSAPLSMPGAPTPRTGMASFVPPTLPTGPTFTPENFLGEADGAIATSRIATLDALTLTTRTPANVPVHPSAVPVHPGRHHGRVH